MSEAATVDFDSTLIRRGVQAATFPEMAEFASIVEARPLDKLLEELPRLAQLSEMKFLLARQVIRRRMRTLPAVEREQLRLYAEEIAGSTGVAVAARIRTYAGSLADRDDATAFTVAVTHSPVLRACAVDVTGGDPGEPQWLAGLEVEIAADRSVRLQLLPEAP